MSLALQFATKMFYFILFNRWSKNYESEIVCVNFFGWQNVAVKISTGWGGGGGEWLFSVGRLLLLRNAPHVKNKYFLEN